MYRINLRVSEGINFPYYVLGKAQLAISPFPDSWVWMDPQSDPYAIFAQEYGIVGQADLADVGDMWYDWLSKTMHNCPECAGDSLRYCGSQLLPIAQRLLPEYLSR